ncbi:unnamed protein product [Schistocephalus solidus]|uniref:Dynein regulatory complex protein 10 n=1 Tax=Schistocephalus solidus TaxID=70667 RepID=A0A183SSY7_SCHSO|nr:unnamed protein product [Schistocephalus solidus]
MSEHSLALWDNLPTISEKDSLVRRVTQVTRVNRTNHVLKPAHSHMQTIEGKRAMLIIDSAITKCLLVSAFPKIIKNLDVWSYALKKRLFELTRQITRELIKVRPATEALIRHYQEWEVEPSGPVKHMTSLLVQLRHLMRHELLTTPKERAQKDEYLAMAERRSLKQAKQVEEKNAEISLLMNKLLKLEEETQTHIQNIHEKFLSDDRVAKSRHNANVTILKDDLQATHQTYKTLCEQHRKDQLAVRREKWKIEDEMDGILKKMDNQLYNIQVNCSS